MSSADSDEHTGTEFGSLASVFDEESNGDDMPATAEDDEDGSDVDHQVFAAVHHTLPIRAPTRDADVASRALLPSSVANGHTDSFTVDVNLQRRDRSRSRTHRYLQEPDASSLQSQPSTALQAAAAKVTTRANLRADNAMPDFTPQPIPPFVALPTRSAQLEPQPSAGLFAVNRTGTGLSTPPTSSFTSTGHVQSVVSAPGVRFDRLTVSESGAKASLTGESPVPPMPRAHVHLVPLTNSVTGADAATRAIPVHDPPARHHTISGALAHSDDPARVRDRAMDLYHSLTADEVLRQHELRAHN